ncbi:DUF6966 domain-containing protein [Yersinia thracica]|uniref:DUF6966 domain-containing protein n=1 Tax=Yersinia thracica TaxID=2890319 RepID=UPI0039A2F7B5
MDYDYDYNQAVYKIFSLYSGMGSLNDFVLYKNGQILQDENGTFDELRDYFHELCTSH